MLADNGPACNDEPDGFDEMWLEEGMAISRQRLAAGMTGGMLACREVRWCWRTMAWSA